MQLKVTYTDRFDKEKPQSLFIDAERDWPLARRESWFPTPLFSNHGSHVSVRPVTQMKAADEGFQPFEPVRYDGRGAVVRTLLAQPS
jgi:hypothetical protein